ncbi:MAG: hypothetical protein V1769_01895 [Thermoplasmatota archaeon]
MRTSYTGICFICVLLYFLIAINAGHCSETVDDLVTCEFTLDVTNGVTFSVHVIADVDAITLSASGKTYSKSEIQSVSISNPELMGAIKYAIKAALSEQLQNTFMNADIVTNQDLPSYATSVFSDSYTITLSPSFFSLGEEVNVYEFVNGMIDCGAFVNYSIPLQASSGWNNTYVFVLSEEMTYRITTGTVKQNSITWTVLNGDGETPQRTAEVTLAGNTPSTSGFVSDSIKVTFEMDCTQPKQPRLSILLNAEAINISPYALPFPLFSNIDIVPSDGVRLLIKNNLTGWDNIFANTLEPASSMIIEAVESSSFNQTIDAIFSWDNTTTTECQEPYNITNMNCLPPVRGMFIDDDVLFNMCSLSSRAVFGLVNAGAKVHMTSADVNFGDNLNTLSYSYDGSLVLPDHVLLNNQRTFLWNQTLPIAGNFSSDVAPSYTIQDIDTHIIIEIESTDMNLVSFFTGKTELTVGVFLSETQRRNVTTLPDHMVLPPQVSLTYLNADGLRLCVEESVFSDEQITSFLSDETRMFENHSKDLFPLLQGKAQVDKESFDQSLQWAGNISSMNDSVPVKVVSTFHSSYPLPFSFLLFPPGLNVSKQEISFTSIPNQSITYTMVFPQGTSVEVNDTLDRAEIRERSDGRKCLVVSFNASEDDLVDVVTVSMRPSVLFILGLFVPCIISLIITIILIVVVYVLRKKRKQFHGPNHKKTNKKSKPSKVSQQVEDNDIELDEEDFYVPPPPSRRR